MAVGGILCLAALIRCATLLEDGRAPITIKAKLTERCLGIFRRKEILGVALLARRAAGEDAQINVDGWWRTAACGLGARGFGRH